MKKVCEFCGGGSPSRRARFCSRKCYHAQRVDPAREFWARTEPSEGCWEWKGLKTRLGYGTLKIKRKDVRAHRLSWLVHFGPIPDEMFVCHHCDNRSCVNPAHLFLGTAADNIADMIAKGRCRPPRGEQCNRSSLLPETVREMRLLWKSGEWTQRALARRYGCSQFNVSSIVRRKTWAHVD